MDFTGWTYVDTYGTYQIWAKGEERILYDPKTGEVELRYTMS
jgi:membrane-bound inhibitor of C-type lysozyme